MKLITKEQIDLIFNKRRDRLTHAYELEELIGGRIYIYLEGNYVPVISYTMKHYDNNMYLVVPKTPAPITIELLPPADYSQNLYVA